MILFPEVKQENYVNVMIPVTEENRPVLEHVIHKLRMRELEEMRGANKEALAMIKKLEERAYKTVKVDAGRELDGMERKKIWNIWKNGADITPRMFVRETHEGGIIKKRKSMIKVFSMDDVFLGFLDSFKRYNGEVWVFFRRNNALTYLGGRGKLEDILANPDTLKSDMEYVRIRFDSNGNYIPLKYTAV